MREWFKPEITNLGLSNTAGSPNIGGNDSLIPDCIEDAFEAMAGDTSGTASPTGPNYSM